jgi:hypothetical protein
MHIGMITRGYPRDRENILLVRDLSAAAPLLFFLSWLTYE